MPPRATQRERLQDVALAGAALAGDQEIFAIVYEAEGREALDDGAIEILLERPVKGLEVLRTRRPQVTMRRSTRCCRSWPAPSPTRARAARARRSWALAPRQGAHQGSGRVLSVRVARDGFGVARGYRYL